MIMDKHSFMKYTAEYNAKNTAKYIALLLAVALTLLSALACAKNGAEDGDQIDLADPSGAEGIVTAAQLVKALEGGAETLTLNASIDLEKEMLTFDRENATLTIIGNGSTISGNGDCIIRLGEGCTLKLEDVTLNAGAYAVGCLGDATLSGSATIRAVAHAIYAEGHVTVGAESRLYVASNVGSGVKAEGLVLEEDARVLAEGALGGVNATKDDIVLNRGSVLNSTTDENYNALKCEGTLVLYDGSKLIVTNNGEYHGAEISEIYVEGVVSIEAKGGKKGVGLFLFALREHINAVGFCEPELRFEVGGGSISFFESAAGFPTPTPEPTETPS